MNIIWAALFTSISRQDTGVRELVSLENSIIMDE